MENKQHIGPPVIFLQQQNTKPGGSALGYGDICYLNASVVCQ